MTNILLIDDNRDFREGLRDLLFLNGYTVWEAECTDDAFKILRDHQTIQIDLTICDLDLPFAKGGKFFSYEFSLEVGTRTIEELRWVFPDMPIIAVTGYHPLDIQGLRKRMESVPIVHKPIRNDHILNLIRQLSVQNENYCYMQ